MPFIVANYTDLNRERLYDPQTGFIDYAAHAVFSPDRKSVVIEIQDGGFCDLDGVANGVIVGLYGIGVNHDDGMPGCRMRPAEETAAAGVS